MAKRERHQKVRPPAQDALESDWRLFVAIPMPEAARNLMGRVIQLLAHEDWPVRWIDPDTAHMTLHFLGATPPEQAELLRMALATPAAKIPTFELKTSGLGVFPNARRPRVIWIGLDGETDQLQRLYREIGGTLSALGLAPDTDRFNPHITLGRVRDTASPAFAAAIQTQLDANSATSRITANSVKVPVDEILLVRSFLDAKGAKHTPIASFPLAK